MRVHVLALDGVFDLGLSAVLDAFQTANELAEMSGFSGERFEVKIVGVSRSVKTSQGLTLPVQAIGSKVPACVVVPAIGYKMPNPQRYFPSANLSTRLTTRDNHQMLNPHAYLSRSWCQRAVLTHRKRISWPCSATPPCSGLSPLALTRLLIQAAF